MKVSEKQNLKWKGGGSMVKKSDTLMGNFRPTRFIIVGIADTACASQGGGA